MRKIIVPVSFGANSANAARYAADIAFVTGAEVRLLYILQPPPVFSRHPMPDFQFKEMEAGGHRLLKQLQDELSKRTYGKVRISAALEIGDIDQRLKTHCTQDSPFLVVMGSTESDHPDQQFEAAHTMEAMRQLSCPLLIVPGNETFHGAPKVVIACDHEDIYSGLLPVLPFLKELRESLGTRFEVVHIADDSEDTADLAKEYEGWKKELEAFEPRLQLVQPTEVRKGINDYLEQHDPAWLLVLPKRHSLLEFHKSRAKDIVLHCPVPVISLHES